jgi:hypothetical protein
MAPAMNLLRTLTLALLVALLLPWGAYPSAMPSGQQPEVVAEIPADGAIEAKRKCRTGLLPGSSCAPDAVSGTRATPAHASAAGRIRFPPERASPATRTLNPPTGPPRLA